MKVRPVRDELQHTYRQKDGWDGRTGRYNEDNTRFSQIRLKIGKPLSKLKYKKVLHVYFWMLLPYA
jgi:hypothetical protein